MVSKMGPPNKMYRKVSDSTVSNKSLFHKQGILVIFKGHSVPCPIYICFQWKWTVTESAVISSNTGKDSTIKFYIRKDLFIR